MKLITIFKNYAWPWALAASSLGQAQNPLNCRLAQDYTPPANAEVYEAMQKAVADAKSAIEFVPFDAAALDIIPASAAGQFQDLGNGLIRIVRTRVIKVIDASKRVADSVTVDEETGRDIEISECLDLPKSTFLAQMNQVEQRLNQAGVSVRGAGDIELARIPVDVQAMRNQLLGELRLQARGVLEKIKAPLYGATCPSIPEFDLGQEMIQQTISLPDGTRLTYHDVLERSKDSQSALCALGYSFLDDISADLFKNPEQAVRELLARRQLVFDQLGLSPLAPGLNLEAFRSLGNIKTLEQAATATLAAVQAVGPEMINDLKRQLNITLPPELQIPAMPDFQLPGPPKRTPLMIKKVKTWNGLNMGERKIVGVEGKAELMIGGSEVDETFRATADVTLYIFNGGFALLDAMGELGAGKTQGVKAHLHTKIVGKDLFPPIDAQASEKLVIEKLDAFKLSNSVGISQTFQIGPIPVAIKAGALYELGLGYRIAIINTSASGAVIPYARVAGYAECGIGFAGFLSAGAGAEITLINLSAPITGGAELRFDPEGYPYLTTFINSDAEFEILNGRIYGYVEFPVPFEIKKETLDIYKFKGPQFRQKIMSWSMDITHQGSKIGGDALDQNDSDEAQSIGTAITLDNRKEALANRRKALKIYADRVFQTIKDDASSDSQQNMIILADLAKEERRVFDDRSTALGESVIPATQ